jgi:hypothetical protein
VYNLLLFLFETIRLTVYNCFIFLLIIHFCNMHEINFVVSEYYRQVGVTGSPGTHIVAHCDLD